VTYRLTDRPFDGKDRAMHSVARVMKLAKLNGQIKLDRFIICESVLMQFAENYQN